MDFVNGLSSVVQFLRRHNLVILLVGFVWIGIGLYGFWSNRFPGFRKGISNVNVVEIAPNTIKFADPIDKFALIEGFKGNLIERLDFARQNVGSTIPTPSPISTPPPVPATRDKVEAYWPREMNKDSSDSIVILLANKAGNVLVAPSANYSSTVAVTGLVEPAKLREYQGNYDVFAKASLSAVNFETASSSTDWQLLDKSEIDWRWNISPKHDRTLDKQQLLNASIDVQFRDKKGTVLDTKPLWRSEFAVTVYSHWLTKDPPNITSLLGMIVGAGFTVPWTYERIKERRRRKQKREVKREARHGRRRSRS